MKKLLIVLGIITCMAGLTACGSDEQSAGPTLPEENAKMFVANYVQALDQIAVVSGGASDYVAYVSAQSGIDEKVLEGAVASWISAAEDMGNYIEVLEIVDNTMLCEVYNDEYYIVGGTISARLKGSSHNAILEITCDDTGITSISTNVEYSFGESMEMAGLNTLLGMGTVFVVLILISVIIAAFGFIPKLMEKNKPTENKSAEKKEDAVVAQIAQREELSDDTELVAVIAAAIAAYEGAGSTDGFVVRSIRKAKSSKW
ncbi:MAG: OadG family protein [Clostridiales bacterium]|nr:OadG family protein [Clostridiales bacterium]